MGAVLTELTTAKSSSVYLLRQIAVALMAALTLSSVQAAMLGEISVRSALGERFNASITVAAAEDEELNANCFRLVSPQDENASGVLRRARLVYQYEVGGGRLLIRGEESTSEPLVTLGVKVKCPGEDERVFQRDYRIFLDPPEYRSGVTQQATDTVLPTVKNTIRRKLPALGGSWLSEEGDSVAKIAASYYPRDKARQQAMIEAIYDLNPDLPQNTNARLNGDWRIQLPMPQQKATPVPAPLIPALQFDLPAAKPLESLPRLSLESEPSTPNSANLARGSGEFRLRLSEINLDTQRPNTLTPEQTLQLRERLLSLESDDQAAQMLQLKYQVTELEKQLASLRNGGSKSSDEQVDEDTAKTADSALAGWLWPLLALLLIPVLYLGWRRWQERNSEPDELYTVISPSTAYLRTQSRLDSSAGYAQSVAFGGLDTQQIGTPIHRDQNEEWHSEDMDVVSPGNVTEEAQLLLDHGLVPQAVNLLSHEIQQFPAALALWMKLFEIFQRNGMPEAFQEKAVAFRLQFASDALWKNVQELGLSIDPANPLYQSLDLNNEPQLLPEEPRFAKNEDLAFASALHAGAGLDMPDEVAVLESPPAPSTLQTGHEFDFDLDSSTTQVEYEAPTFELVADVPQDTSGVNDTTQYQGGSALDAIAATEVDEIQIDAVETVDEIELSPLAPAMPSPLEPVIPTSTAGIFKSDDPALQEIARCIENGQRKEAFAQLEEMLYKGTMPQRLTASKWLDKLLGMFGSN